MGKILVFTKNWFGDVVMQTPCFRILKENFPGARLVVATPLRTKPVVQNNPFVDDILTFNEREEERGFFAKIRFIWRLRKEKFTRVYLLHRSRTRALLCLLAGIPVRVGYARKGRRFILTHSIPQPNRAMHQTDYAVHLLKASGLKVPLEYPCEFHFSRDDEERIEKLCRELIPERKERVIALNPGANWEPKRWPAEYFAELADQLYERSRATFVITGSGSDQTLAERIISHAQKVKPVSLCGRMSLGELGAFLSRCDFVVTADSGPMHIASGVGTPVACLFGPTDFSQTGPRGKGSVLILRENSNGKTDPQTLMCALRPEKVLRALEERKWI